MDYAIKNFKITTNFHKQNLKRNKTAQKMIIGRVS